VRIGASWERQGSLFRSGGTAPSALDCHCPESENEELIMKTIASALLALSVLAGFAATASAAPYEESIWPYLDRDNRGGQSQ
jgi:hypothetical protein